MLFVYTVFWGCDCIEEGLVRADDILQAIGKVAARAGGKLSTVAELTEADFDGDFYVVHES
jgi:hypothetical protein